MDEAGASDARTALAVKAAAAIDLSIDRPELTQLLDVLHDTGQDSVIGGMLRDLLGRDGAPGARIVSFVLEHSHRLGLDVLRAEIEGDVLPLVSLADPAAAASLLRELRRADVPAAGVADRAALEALVDRRGTAALLAEMRESGLTTAVEILAGRIKDEGDPDHPELELVMAELKQLGADATIDVIVDRAMKTAKRHGLAGRVDLLRTLGGLGYPSDAIETLARDTPLSISFSDRAGQDLEYVWLAVHEIPRTATDRRAGGPRRVRRPRGSPGSLRRNARGGARVASKFLYGRTADGGPEPAWGWDSLKRIAVTRPRISFHTVGKLIEPVPKPGPGTTRTRREPVSLGRARNTRRGASAAAVRRVWALAEITSVWHAWRIILHA